MSRNCSPCGTSVCSLSKMRLCGRCDRAPRGSGRHEGHVQRAATLARLGKDIIKVATPLDEQLHRQSLQREERQHQHDAHLSRFPFGASSDRTGICARTRLSTIDRGAPSPASLGTRPLSYITTQRDNETPPQHGDPTTTSTSPAAASGPAWCWLWSPSPASSASWSPWRARHLRPSRHAADG